MSKRDNGPILPQVVILAAGQGLRLGAVSEGRPKALMPMAGQPLLLRTVRQLEKRGFSEITVIVGYQSQRVTEALGGCGRRLRFVENVRYAVDTNIGSLLLGLGDSDAAALVIEADIVFDDAAMDAMTAAASGGDSVWFTRGPFQSHELGGILQTDGQGRLTHLHYTPVYEPKFAGYKKLVGVVYVGPREMPRFRALLQAAAAQTTAQYYMIPWCRHLDVLPAREGDLAHCRVATFNTAEDYDRCCELFESKGVPCQGK